jgi:hypothetical protein
VYYLDNIAKILNLRDQLPGYSVVASEDYIGITGPTYSIAVYGWPDNRICFENKIEKTNSVKSFGPQGVIPARQELEFLLNSIGVDLTALHA